jgi:hypothetical protein
MALEGVPDDIIIGVDADQADQMYILLSQRPPLSKGGEELQIQSGLFSGKAMPRDFQITSSVEKGVHFEGVFYPGSAEVELTAGTREDFEEFLRTLRIRA